MYNSIRVVEAFAVWGQGFIIEKRQSGKRWR
jgi:hypothetical protein